MLWVSIGAGLPNITGSSGDAFKSNSSFDKSSGCIQVTDYSDSGSWDSDFNGYTAFTLDASRSSLIYGSSDTVTPLSLSTSYILKY